MVPLVVLLTLMLNEVMPAPSSGSEWVELYNPTDESVDVSGWRIDDDTPGGTQTTIPAGSVVAPHGYLVIPLSSAILNNTGDSATLLDPAGSVVDSVAFGALKGSESIGRQPDGADSWAKGPPSPGNSNSPAPMASPTVTASHTATVTAIPSAQPTTQPALADTPIPSETASALPILASETPFPTASPAPTEPLPASSTRTATETATPSTTRTPSVTKTPSATKTPSMTKTPSHTKTPSVTKTASVTKTPSRTKSPSVTKTPSRTRTPSRSKTASRTKTPSRTKTASRTKIPSRTTRATASAAQRRDTRRVSRTTVRIRASAARSVSSTATPAQSLGGLPSPALRIGGEHATASAPFSPTRTASPTQNTAQMTAVAPAQPVAPSLPLLPIGSVLLMLGWIGLRVFARAAAPMLYSEADEEAETRADPPAQRVEAGESSTSGCTDGTAESLPTEQK